MTNNEQKEINAVYSKICDALTFKQYQAWTTNSDRTYRSRFSRVKRFSKSSRILSLAAEGIKLCDLYGI
jgi:hypothetical protein